MQPVGSGAGQNNRVQAFFHNLMDNATQNSPALQGQAQGPTDYLGAGPALMGGFFSALGNASHSAVNEVGIPQAIQALPSFMGAGSLDSTRNGGLLGDLGNSMAGQDTQHVLGAIGSGIDWMDEHIGRPLATGTVGTAMATSHDFGTLLNDVVNHPEDMFGNLGDTTKARGLDWQTPGQAYDSLPEWAQGSLSALFDPVIYLGGGAVGDSVKVLGKVTRIGALAKLGIGIGDAERQFSRILRAPLQMGVDSSAIRQLPVFKEIFGPGERHYLTESRNWAASAADAVLGSSTEPTSRSAITRLYTDNLADLSDDEKNLRSVLDTFYNAADDVQTSKLVATKAGEVVPAFDFGLNHIEQLKDLSPSDATKQIGQYASDMQHVSITEENIKNKLAKTGWLNETLVPALAPFQNGWRQFVQRGVNGLSSLYLNTPFYPVHLASEEAVVARAGGVAPGFQSTRDFLMTHAGNPGFDQIVASTARDRLGKMGELSGMAEYGENAATKFTPGTSGIKSGLKYVLSPGSWKDWFTKSFRQAGQSVAENMQFNTYSGMVENAVRPKLTAAAEQFPELQQMMQHVFTGPPLGFVDHLRDGPELTRSVMLSGGSTDKLQSILTTYQNKDLLGRDVVSAMNNLADKSEGLSGLVHKYMDQFKTTGSLDINKMKGDIRAEQDNFHMSRLLSQPDEFHTSLSQLLETLGQNPEFVAAAPKETQALMNAYAVRFTRMPDDIRYVAQRQTFPGMDRDLRNKIWSDADSMVAQHLQRNGPLFDNLLGRIQTIAQHDNLPLQHIAGMLKETGALTAKTWQTDRSAVASLGRPAPGYADAWWNKYQITRDKIWGQHRAEISAITNRALGDADQFAMRDRVMPALNDQQLQQSRQQAVLSYQQMSGRLSTPEPELMQRAREGTEGFLNDLQAIFDAHHQRDFTALAQQHIQGVMGMANQLPDEARNAWAGAVKDGYDAANKQYWLLHTDPTRTMSNFDDTMRAVGMPYWTYQAQRPRRILATGLSMPLSARGYLNYFNQTDGGYFPLGDTPIAASYSKFGMQKLVNSSIKTGQGIANWLSSGQDYESAARPNGLPTTELTNPFWGTMDVAQRWLNTVGWTPGAHVEAALAIGRGAEGANPDAYGLIPGAWKIPGSLAAAAGTAGWIPPSVRAGLNLIGGPMYSLNREAQNIFGDKYYNYYTNQRLAEQGITPSRASQAQIDDAQKWVMSWQTVTEMSGATGMRPSFADIRDSANSVAKQYGIPEEVINQDQFKRNPTAVLYARDAQGVPLLDKGQLAQVMQDHPQWNAWREVATPLLTNDKIAQQKLVTDFADEKDKLLQFAVNAKQPLIAKALQPGSGISATDFRNSLGDLQQVHEAILANQSALYSQLPQGQLPERPEDVAAERYFAIKPSEDPVTGQPDWDSFQQERQDLLNEMDPATKDYVLNRYTPAAEWQQYSPEIAHAFELQKNAYKVLEPYFQLGTDAYKEVAAKYGGQQFLTQFPTYKDLVVAMRCQAEQTGMPLQQVMDSSPLIQEYTSTKQIRQQQYRSMFPEADLALSVMFDANPVRPEIGQIANAYRFEAFNDGPPSVYQQVAQIGAQYRSANNVTATPTYSNQQNPSQPQAQQPNPTATNLA